MKTKNTFSDILLLRIKAKGMINMRKIHPVKGFTLVEVMVSLVIVSILIAMSSVMIIASLNMLGKNAQIRDAQNNANSVYNLIEKKLEYAVEVNITPGGEKNSVTGAYTEKIYINDGAVVINCDPTDKSNSADRINKSTVCSKQMLRGADIDISFSRGTQKESIFLSVKIKRDEQVIYERSGEIPFLNYSYITDENFCSLKADTSISGDMTIGYSYFE